MKLVVEKFIAIEVQSIKMINKSVFIALVTLLTAAQLSSSSPIENEAQLVIKRLKLLQLLKLLIFFQISNGYSFWRQDLMIYNHK